LACDPVPPPDLVHPVTIKIAAKTRAAAKETLLFIFSLLNIFKALPKHLVLKILPTETDYKPQHPLSEEYSVFLL
jgi:hypothetical protein